MSSITIHTDVNNDRFPNAAGRVQKLINLTQATWHAAFAGGAGAIDVTAGPWTDPVAAEADRIPELALTAVGTPGAYTITGTYNSVAQTEQITTVAGSTVKGNLPFDTVTRFQGPDPGAGKSVTLYKGDSYADPPARALYTGTANGNAAVQLVGESAVKAVPVAAYRDWSRRVRRIAHATAAIPTTLTTPYFVW